MSGIPPKSHSLNDQNIMGQSRSIIQEIKQGKISPVYLLHGEEAYLIDDTLEEMIETLLPKNVRDFNLDIFSDPETSVDEVLSIAKTYPVMSERRVVILKDPAFLSSSKKLDLLEIFQQSRDTYKQGNLQKSAALLARSLNLDPEEFAEGGTQFKRALDTFKKDNESSLSSDDIDFLNDTANALTTEFEMALTSTSTDSVGKLIEYAKSQPSVNTVLIIALNVSLDSSHKLVKAISQTGKVINFVKLRKSSYTSKDPMFQIVRDRLREYKKAISQDAFQELQKKTGNNMRQIFDEIDKLVTFIGERQQIEKSDIENLVTQTGYDVIFDLTNAIGQRSLPLALANLRSILEKGEHPILIHTMITRQIRFLLQAKLLLENGDLKPEIVKMSYDVFQGRVYEKLSPQLIEKLPESKQLNLLKQHPYPIYITLKQAGNFTIQELINAMERLLEADIQLKSSYLTPEIVIETLVMDLVGL